MFNDSSDKLYFVEKIETALRQVNTIQVCTHNILLIITDSRKQSRCQKSSLKNVCAFKKTIQFV